MAEGYSRSSGKDRVRFFEYSLGSARESRDWYYKGRHILGETVTAHRVNLVTQITRLLLTYIPDQRHVTLKEESATYDADAIPPDLLTDIPL
jgi:four helix bundle protein